MKLTLSFNKDYIGVNKIIKAVLRVLEYNNLIKSSLKSWVLWNIATKTEPRIVSASIDQNGSIIIIII